MGPWLLGNEWHDDIVEEDTVYVKDLTVSFQIWISYSMKKPSKMAEDSGEKARKKHRITFACAENTCRSPMAKVIMEDLLSRDVARDVEVDSVALERAGPTVNEKAREVIKERYGRDLLKDHIPRLIDYRSLGRLVLVMTTDQKDDLDKKLGNRRDESIVLKVSELVLPSLDDHDSGFGKDVTDPAGKPLDDYRIRLEQLSRYLWEGRDRAIMIVKHGLYAGWSRRGYPKACPNCKSGRVVPIGYGLPTMEFEAELVWYGAVGRDPPCVLGGCCVPGTDDWHCLNCDHEWATERKVNSQEKKLSEDIEIYRSHPSRVREADLERIRRLREK